MESNHASRGRRTLEEIRQKRAVERMHKASSGSDLDASNPHGTYAGATESNSVLLSRIKEFEMKKADLEDENKKLSLKMEEKKKDNGFLQKKLNDLEESTLPSLRKALNDTSIEKDAAIVAREDLAAQLRTIKRRLKQAEEEQYRAEEDAATLRAELNVLQQQEIRNGYAGISSMSDSVDRIQALEKEVVDLKFQLQQELLLRQQEQQKLEEERTCVSSLMSEKQELERRLTEFSKRSLEEASEEDARKALLKDDKEKLEKQLHDMAVMIERLEGSRQKLLKEVDSQSSEIERLFDENATLLASYQEATNDVSQWQIQVKECLKRNQELREQLDKLRFDKANPLDTSDKIASLHESLGDPSAQASFHLLKNQLAKEQSKSEKLSAEVMHLSAELKTAVYSYNNLTRLYGPALKDIEKGLMKMKQDNYENSLGRMKQ